jgi:hypothetical protein
MGNGIVILALALLLIPAYQAYIPTAQDTDWAKSAKDDFKYCVS